MKTDTPILLVRPRGFTIVEFLVASILASILLLGAYDVFKQVLDAEQRHTLRIQASANAQAVADTLSNALRHAINVKDQPGIIAGPDSSGNRQLTCITTAGLRDGDLRHQRYRWNTPSNPHSPTILYVAQLASTGAANIDATARPGEDDGADPWARTPEIPIAADIQRLSIDFKPAGDPSRDWSDRWAGPAGHVLIRIVVQAHDQTLERIVAPRADARLSTTP